MRTSVIEKHASFEGYELLVDLETSLKAAPLGDFSHLGHGFQLSHDKALSLVFLSFDSLRSSTEHEQRQQKA